MFNACLVEQVIYPALEAKVANVTRSYSVEHEDEVTADDRGSWDTST